MDKRPLYLKEWTDGPGKHGGPSIPLNWRKKLARILLNALTVATIFVPLMAGIKKGVTGTSLYSLHGKTYDAGEAASHEVDKFHFKNPPSGG